MLKSLRCQGGKVKILKSSGKGRLNEETEYITINNKMVRRLQKRPGKAGKDEVQEVFIIGSKGIPALYGGFETFVEKLTEYRINKKIRYHVARMADDNIRYEYNGVECFDINVPRIGAAKAVWYDIAALYASVRWCRRNPNQNPPVFYILACRIGPVAGWFKRRIKKLGGFLYLNPDGHEWQRAKWSRPVQYYWKLSERFMVKHADMVICDSMRIKKYIEKEYKTCCPATVFIPYGADASPSVLSGSEGKYADWLKKRGLKAGEYYLAVSRFVPENNFEIMIREFMETDSRKSFVIITTSNDRFQQLLEKKLHYSDDARIQFAGTVYDTELLKKIRENAYAYFHGHEVGGTNPSLLEALGSTDVNLLLDVEFNREVAGESALYWTKERGSLSALIAVADKMSRTEIYEMGVRAKRRICEAYKWEDIVEKYETLFFNHDVGTV